MSAVSGWFNPQGITRIGVDVDEVLAHWNPNYDRHLDMHGERAALIPRTAQRLAFNLKEGRTPAEKKLIDEIMSTPGFYAELEPIDGGKAALEGMKLLGYEVYLVTSPWLSNPTCASDKLNWIQQHLGRYWAERTIITSHKYMVDVQLLIDDKPEIKNADQARWTQVVFDQPYNRHVAGPRLNGWGNWYAELFEDPQRG